ncbi:MAG: TolC family protein [Candidatus Palauibacterales bacterium]|nr:TolC family protein [Candidatus Palauibacterales bacterium]
MPRLLRLTASCALLLLGLIPRVQAQEAPSPTSIDLETKTTLPQLIELARRDNPRLQAARALAEARDVSRSWVGVLPDPRIQLGMMNLSLPGFGADMPSSMAPAVQVTQVVPFPGKLGLEGEIAGRTAEMARADADESWWTIRARVAGAFWNLYAADRHIEVLGETKGRLEDFELAARALYEAGTGRQTDVLQAQVEVARLAAEVARARASRIGAEARLNALLGRPVGTSVPHPVAEGLPSEHPALDSLRDWAEAHRPAVARDRLAVERAETRADRAGREIWPDLMLGAAYGQRNVAGSVQRMASFTVSFQLPIFAGRRQLRLRDEAASMETMARAELAETRARVDARLGELAADLDRTGELLRLYREEILPEARMAVESAFASYRVGAVDFRTLVDAQTALDRYESEFHALVADYGDSVAEMEATIGRELPPADPIDPEIP